MHASLRRVFILGGLLAGGLTAGCDGPGLSDTSTGTVEVSTAPLEQRFTATADARVESASPSSNFGSDGTLRVDGSSTGEPTITSYLRFDVSGVSGTVQRAVLRLYVTSGTANGPRVFPTSTTWTEGGLTWNNAPAATGAFLADADGLGTDTWAELDVTAAVTGNGAHGFLLRTTLTDGSNYASRESGATAPQLVVTTADAPPPPPGNVFYVSRTGNNADGRSEATAWNELNRIQWALLQPGDTLIIKGGTYRQRLIITADGESREKPLTLRADGQVIIDGGRNVPLPTCTSTSFSTPSVVEAPAIVASGRKYLRIDGMAWRGIVVRNWLTDREDSVNAAIDLRGATGITLRNLEVTNNGDSWTKAAGEVRPTGNAFNITGSSGVEVERLIAHDNGNDTFRVNEGGVRAFRLSESWVYNSDSDYRCEHPDVLQVREPGITSGITINDSVFGPRLHHVLLVGDQTQVEKIRVTNVLSHHSYSSAIALRQGITRDVVIDRLTSHLEWASVANMELAGGTSEAPLVLSNSLHKNEPGSELGKISLSSNVECPNTYRHGTITATACSGPDMAERTLRFKDQEGANTQSPLCRNPTTGTLINPWLCADFTPLNTDINGAGATLHSAMELLAR